MQKNYPILKMTDIDKRFTGVHALKNAYLDLYSGEVLALMGENGAGKSTLMKILCGIKEADSGEIMLFNKQVKFKDIKESQEAGISIIHQELNMMPHLTVAQNIYIGREQMNFGFIDDNKMVNNAKELFKKLNMNIDPSLKLSSLTVGKQQMVEIAKAISFNSKILILDEPTAALTQTEVDELFKIMRELKQKGIGMIYISHRMDEINEISDRVTVMRDGEYVGTVKTKDTTKDEIVKMMVGRAILGDKKEKSAVKENAPTILKVENLSNHDTVKGISFRLKKGEILGFSGLMGSGRTEAMRLIFGANSKTTGEIFINGKRVNNKSPKDAVKNGLCYLSEDRKQYGLLLNKSVSENTVLASLEKFISLGFLNKQREITESYYYNKKLKTKTPSMEHLVKNLSGGNQQKVILARWLLKNSDIFIFDEPTRGIDVGAKSEMYELIEELTSNGKSVIVVSSELSEIQRLSDRVIVMCEGKITAELNINEVTQEEIMKYATKREI